MSTTAAAPAVPVDTKNRTNFLSSLIGRPVLIKLFSGAVYHGILASIDGRMNLALEQTEEFIDGRLTAQLGDAFLRGNNIMYVALQKKKKSTA